MLKYEFVNINEMPINAISLKTSFGGIVLDDLGAGFTTLNVFGREIPLINVKTTPKAFSDGVWVDTQVLDARRITVEAKVDSADMLDTTSALMGALWSGEKELSFNDDDQNYYKAYFIGTNQPEMRSNTSIVRFEFLCADPYKYRAEQDVVTGKWVASYTLPSIPDELVVTLAANGAAGIPLKITNARSGKQIVIDTETNFAIGDVVTIKWGKVPELKLGNTNILPMINIEKDFELFELINGDELTITPSSTYSMKIRRKYY